MRRSFWIGLVLILAWSSISEIVLIYLSRSIGLETKALSFSLDRFIFSFSVIETLLPLVAVLCLLASWWNCLDKLSKRAANAPIFAATLTSGIYSFCLMLPFFLKSPLTWYVSPKLYASLPSIGGGLLGRFVSSHFLACAISVIFSLSTRFLSKRKSLK